MWQILRKKLEIPSPDNALPGRAKPAFAVPTEHFVNGNPLEPPFPAGLETAVFGHGLLLGRRAQVLAAAGRLHDRGRLCRRATRPTRPTRRCAPA